MRLVLTSPLVLGFVTSVLLMSQNLRAEDPSGSKRFAFANEPGATLVTPDAAYDDKAGFGFEPGAAVTLAKTADGRAYVTSNRQFAFSAGVPEGNYDVTVDLLGIDGTRPTIKVEQRRLVLEAAKIPANGVLSAKFTVNVRRPTVAGGDAIHLKKDEMHSRNWDDHLTITFYGDKPAVAGIRIEPNTSAPSILIAGDSTVCDQGGEPYTSWGQMLPRFFKPGVAVANYAESGETLKSFIAENRTAKVLSMIRPGDYLLIQFGHNDQKDKSADAGAYNSYTKLLKQLADDAKAKGAKVVLVTPVSRRFFKGNEVTNSLGDFPAAVRDLAKSENLPLIDLNLMTKAFYEAMGPDESKKAFPPIATEKTHHNNYGAYEVAKCVIQSIKDAHLDLEKFIVEDWATYDPSHPDPIDTFDVPADASAAPSTKPEGN